ncbi:MAG: methyl-accepting chemotaxis protein [Fibromonadales bacterium]|nr:methyl-accepting chemotaxis protein [Fibromonadales bacterium]
MKNVIAIDIDKCVGCDRCIRVCPVDEANYAFGKSSGQHKIKIDNAKCIVCGNCLTACNHNSRNYQDDTERFFADLRAGTPISMFAGPAVRANFDKYGQLFEWLRSLGVKFIYDVSLGADICTWAHIRYIQKNGPSPIISQPCPAIVNYVLIYNNKLLKNLSPIHSPMLCTAIFMRKYENIRTKIAALSPCVAKTNEFEATNIVDYNVTFKKLNEYIKKNHITLPSKSSDFDSYKAGLGSLYSMPGGLKESVEHYIGKSLRVDKSEGPSLVYKALAEYAEQPAAKLPVLFDVLNCTEGCNAGTGCVNDRSIFEINTRMDSMRQAAIKENNLQYIEDLFKKFDETLKIEDFIRHYVPVQVNTIRTNPDMIEKAFISMGKLDESSRNFNCGACGCDTCGEMAVLVSKGMNFANNCAEKMRIEIEAEHTRVKDILENNLQSFNAIIDRTDKIKSMTNGIVSDINDITSAIALYDNMVTDIERISEKVNIISLNASVEAAKAGNHGLAFGVVAKEIRTLAESSANSALRTKEVSGTANNTVKVITKAALNINDSIKSVYDYIKSAHDSTTKELEK